LIDVSDETQLPTLVRCLHSLRSVISTCPHGKQILAALSKLGHIKH
jgi:hypothetical protein